MRPRAWTSWSSGKDSAYALQVIHDQEAVDVVGLLTTVNADADRVAVHAVRRTLLEAQAERLGLPLRVLAYREEAIAGSGITALFPLSGRATEELAHEMLAAGVRAVLTCVDPAQLARR